MRCVLRVSSEAAQRVLRFSGETMQLRFVCREPVNGKTYQHFEMYSNTGKLAISFYELFT